MSIMLSQARIERSKQKYRPFADRNGLVARIPTATKSNSGKPLDPFEVTKIFQRRHAERKAALSKAAQSFGKKKRSK